MIDPNNVTKFDRTDDELMEFWFFCLFVRGKNATVQAQKLEQFLQNIGGMHGLRLATPWRVEDALRQVKAGQYTTLSEALWWSDLMPVEWFRKAAPESLETIPGVGPKTARFFIAHTRASARVAVLDTHIVRFMGTQVSYKVGSGTPASAKLYARLEADYLALADAEGVHPADMDLALWRASREGRADEWRDFLPDKASIACVA